VHRAIAHKFSDKVLVNVPDALAVYCALLVPKFSETVMIFSFFCLNSLVFDGRASRGTAALILSQ
jgi:hypothetical protein